MGCDSEQPRLFRVTSTPRSAGAFLFIECVLFKPCFDGAHRPEQAVTNFDTLRQRDAAVFAHVDGVGLNFQQAAEFGGGKQAFHDKAPMGRALYR